MQSHGGTAAATAILSKDREFRSRIIIDWDGDLQFNHELSEISGFVKSVSVERSLEGSAPSELLLVEGSAAAQLSVTLSGEWNGLPFSSLFSPYNRLSPFYGKPLVGAGIDWAIFVDTPFGTFSYVQFVGFIREISPDRGDNLVEITAMDRAELLRRPIQLPFWAVSNEHLNYGEEPSQLAWSHWVIDNCLRLCDVSPAPVRPKFREEIEDYPSPNTGPQFYLTGNGSFLPTIGWMDNPNATSFPAPGTSMYTNNGPLSKRAPAGAARPMGLAGLNLPVSHAYGDPDKHGILRYWIADRGGLDTYGMHYLGLTLNTVKNNENKAYTTALTPLIEIRIGGRYYLHIDIQAGMVRTRLYNEVSNTHTSGPGISIPRDADHVDVFAQWDMDKTSGLRSYIVATNENGVGFTSNWVNHGSVPTNGLYDQIAGRVTIMQAVDMSDIAYAVRYYTGAGYEYTEAYKRAQYVAQLDRGLNKLSFMPAGEKREAWDIIKDVAAAEFGSVFWDEDGVFRFWNWDTMKSKQATAVRDVSLDHLASLKFTNTIDSVRNVFTVNATKRRAQGIVKVFDCNDANEFYVPARSWKTFQIWVDDCESPLTFRPAKYDTDDDPTTSATANFFPNWTDEVIHGYCCQYYQNGAWAEDGGKSGIDIEIYFDVNGFLTVKIWNAWTMPIRLASGVGEDSRGAFRIAGTLISDDAQQSITMTNYESLRKHGPRNLELGGAWRQDFYAQTSAVWSLFQRTAEPIPATDSITIPGDPRLQLADCIDIHDVEGFGEGIRAQILGYTRTWDVDTGLTDELTIEVVNLPYAAGEVERPPEPEEEPDGGDPGTSPGGGGGGVGGVRTYFQAADWHWDPIVANPILDTNSSNIVNQLRQGQHVLNTIEYGNTLRGPDGITGATPRYNIGFSYTSSWGPAFSPGATMPIPDSVTNAQIAPGGDKHLAVADPTTNKVYSLWIAQKSGSSWNAGWGGEAPLDGEGRETVGGSTGAGISRYACVIRESELAAGEIPHALFFSTNIARPGEVRYPATKTDGSNMSGVASNSTIPEGARVQLNPSLNPDAYGLNTAERAVFVALQKYGAYCGDNGGARMAFLCELSPTRSGSNPGTGYTGAGVTGDYYNLTKIPWDQLRVLRTWNGT